MLYADYDQATRIILEAEQVLPKDRTEIYKNALKLKYGSRMTVFHDEKNDVSLFIERVDESHFIYVKKVYHNLTFTYYSSAFSIKRQPE